MSNWYYSVGGKAEGPVDETFIVEALRTERITLVDLIFQEGDSAWVTVGEIEVFRQAFHESKRAMAAAAEAAATAASASVSPTLHATSISALSAADEWVILRKVEGQFEQIGPFTRDFVLAKLGTGEIEYSQFAWKPGFQRWVRIGNLDEFDRRRRDRDADPLLERHAQAVPLPSWEEEAQKTPSPKFEELQTSILQFDHPLSQMLKRAQADAPPADAAGMDLLGSSTSPGLRPIGNADDSSADFTGGGFQDEATPSPDFDFQSFASKSAPSPGPASGFASNGDTTEKKSPLVATPAAIESEPALTAHDEAVSDEVTDAGLRSFDELTQPSFHPLPPDEIDEKTGDFSPHVDAQPLLDPVSMQPAEIRAKTGPATPSTKPLRPQSEAAGLMPAPALPPPVLEDEDKTRIESSYSITQAILPPLASVRPRDMEMPSLAEAEPFPGLVAMAPALPQPKEPLPSTQGPPSVPESPFATGSLRESLRASVGLMDDATVVAPRAFAGGAASPATSSVMRPGDPQSGVMKFDSLDRGDGRPDSSQNSDDLKSKSVYEELADGRTVVAPSASRAKAAAPTSSTESSKRDDKRADKPESKLERTYGGTGVGRTFSGREGTLSGEGPPTGVHRSPGRSGRVTPTQLLRIARLFVAGLALGVMGLYAFHVYSTHQFGLGSRTVSRDSADGEIEGPPDQMRPGQNAGSGAGPNVGRNSNHNQPLNPQLMPPPPPSTSGAASSPPPPPNSGSVTPPSSSVNAQTTPAINAVGAEVSKVAKMTDEEDEDDEPEESSKSSRSALALSSLSGVKPVAPAIKTTALEILPYKLASTTPLILLQTNAPIGEKILLRLKGRSGEILKYRSFSRSFRIVRNANEYPGVDLSKLNLPTGTYKVEVADGDLKRSMQVLIGSRDAKFSQEIEHHLKEISYEQQREKKTMFFVAKRFEGLAQDLNDNFSKLHTQSPRWRSYLQGWNREVAQARAPLTGIIGDRKNYPMAYPDEMRGLAKMVSQLSLQAKELDSAVMQKRDVASQSPAAFAREFSRIKQEVAQISARRSQQ